MADVPTRQDDFCTAVERIKQVLAKYRPDVTHLKGNAVLSPRILMLLIERSEGQIPASTLVRLRPLAEAILSISELGNADLVGVPVPDDVQAEIRTGAEATYDSLAKLHAEVMKAD